MKLAKRSPGEIDDVQNDDNYFEDSTIGYSKWEDEARFEKIKRAQRDEFSQAKAPKYKGKKRQRIKKERG